MLLEDFRSHEMRKKDVVPTSGRLEAILENHLGSAKISIGDLVFNLDKS